MSTGTATGPGPTGFHPAAAAGPAAAEPGGPGAAAAGPSDATRTGLRRFTGPRPVAARRCELCSVEVGDEHRHLVDTEQRVLACACMACAMLFDRAGAGGGRFRTVPDRYLADPGWGMEAGGWEALGVPVGVAFFFRNSALDRMVALYPSPAGATESEIEPGTWQAVFGGSPLERALLPDVEALLVRRERDHGPAGRGSSCHLVPVDAAYELVGRLRLHWQGFDGGSRAHAELTAFFDDVARRARPVPADLRGGGGQP